MQNSRIMFIDYLKVIGLLCVILAHVCANPIIFQIRSFDVPLMVIVSGFLAINSYKRSVAKDNSILDYYWKRITRLVFPTWIFLIFYFLLVYIVSVVKGINYPYGILTVLGSFLLLDGIGFVWIIRVYLICAFLTPIIYYFNDNIKSWKIKLAILIILYVLYELLVHFGFEGFLFSYIIAYAIPYGMIYVLGMVSKNMEWKWDLEISLMFSVVFIVSGLFVYLTYNGFQPTQIMKYPPRVYYISYALFMSFLLLGIFKRIDLKSFKLIEFCSESSLWIYLWHILFVNAVPMVFGTLNWIIYYFIVMICAVLVTYVQNRLVDLLESKNVNNNVLKLFRG